MTRIGVVAAAVLMFGTTAVAQGTDAGAPVTDAGSADAGAPRDEVSLLAVGDVMLCRTVRRVIVRKDDIHYPFLRIRDLLHTGDLVFGNLENPITPGEPVPRRGMVFRADPGMEVALKDAGFQVMSGANNHMGDHGPRGVINTLAALRSQGIEGVGLGADDEEAAKPVIVERQGIRFAFLAYNDPAMVPKRYAAGPKHAGTNFAIVSEVRRAVAAVRPLADIVIVSMHHGKEYSTPIERQIAFAHAAIDSGADLVIGHHPHVVQSVERYKGRFIAYSLGNFVFDQTFSHAVKEGVVLRARFRKTGLTSLQFLPIVIHNAAQPRLSRSAAVRERMVQRLGVDLTTDGFVQLADAEPAAGAKGADPR